MSTQSQSRVSGEELFIASLPMITRITATIARQQRLSPQDAEDFTSIVRLRLIKDDYGVLRKFQGRSTLRTFLIVVIRRMCLDYRTSEWGKWRPSRESQRLGPAAVRLERLRVRDGLTFEEAYFVLSTDHRIVINRETLERFDARLHPRRWRPALVTDEELVNVPTEEISPHERLRNTEDSQLLTTAIRELAAIVATLPAQDRLILKLLFVNGLTIAQITRLLRLDPKSLYRRLPRLSRALRTRLVERGVSPANVVAALGRSDAATSGIFEDDGDPGVAASNVA